MKFIRPGILTELVCFGVIIAAAHTSSAKMTETEAVLARVCTIQARKLTEASGIAFNKGWTPVISIQWIDNRYDAAYDSASGTITISTDYAGSFERRQRVAIRHMTPEKIAADPNFARLVKHELGHVLADQVSRRIGNGVWYLPEDYYRLKKLDRIAIRVVDEGIAHYFSRVPKRQSRSSGAWTFPTTLSVYPSVLDSEDRLRTMRDTGGYWLVRDILAKHGERGVAWLVSNPLIFHGYDNLRKAAIEYRNRALQELGGTDGTRTHRLKSRRVR